MKKIKVRCKKDCKSENELSFVKLPMYNHGKEFYVEEYPEKRNAVPGMKYYYWEEGNWYYRKDWLIFLDKENDLFDF